MRATLDKLDGISFDMLLERCDPFNRPECRLDLSEVHLVTPAGLVQLAATCHALSLRDKMATVVVPDTSVRSYLCRSGWVKVIEPVARIEPPAETSDFYGSDYLRGTNPMLLEVTKLDSGEELPELLERVLWVLRNRLRYHKYDAFDVATAISEVCQNTFEHNKDGFGFIAMQVYGKGTRRFVEIGVADCGVGFAATLSRNTSYEKLGSDAEAIKIATRLGTSQYADPTRGTGLYHLLEITYKHAGSVQIRSGRAKVRYRMDQKQGWLFPVAWLPGVQVAITLPTKKT